MRLRVERRGVRAGGTFGATSCLATALLAAVASCSGVTGAIPAGDDGPSSDSGSMATPPTEQPEGSVDAARLDVTAPVPADASLADAAHEAAADASSADAAHEAAADASLADAVADGPADALAADAALEAGPRDSGPDCDAVLSAMMSAPILPPDGWFGFDLSAGSTSDGGVPSGGMTIDQTALLACALYVEPTTLAPGIPPSLGGYRGAFFGASSDAGPGALSAYLAFNVESRVVFESALYPGYRGRLEFHSRAGGAYGSHQYAVSIASAGGTGGEILRDGAPFAPDWNASPFNGWANELYDGLIATFAPSLPAVSDCATAFFTDYTGGLPQTQTDCQISPFQPDGDHLEFPPLGLTWVLASGQNQVIAIYGLRPGGRAASCATPRAALEAASYSLIYGTGEGFDIGGFPTNRKLSNGDGLTVSEANPVLGCAGAAWTPPENGLGGMQWGNDVLAMEYNLDSGVNYKVYAQSGYRGFWQEGNYKIGVGLLQAAVPDDAGVPHWTDTAIDWTSVSTASPTVTAIANAWYGEVCGASPEADCVASGDCSIVVDDGQGHSSFTLAPSPAGALAVGCVWQIDPIAFVFAQGSRVPAQIVVTNPLGWSFPTGPAAGADGSAPDASVGGWCGNYEAPIEYDPGAYVSGSVSPIEDGGGADGAATLPGPAPMVCSGVGLPPVSTLQIVNDAPCAIELWWVDFSCREVFYQTVPPGGASAVQSTFETHAWRLRTTGTHELLRDIAPLGAAAVSVTYP